MATKHGPDTATKAALGMWVAVATVVAFFVPIVAVSMFATLLVYTLYEILFELREIRLLGERNDFARRIDLTVKETQIH